MKITRITVYQVDLPLEHPYWLSGGRLKFECLDATVVKLETDAGITGWGEGTPWGHTYLPAHGPESLPAFCCCGGKSCFSVSGVECVFVGDGNLLHSRICVSVLCVLCV